MKRLLSLVAVAALAVGLTAGPALADTVSKVQQFTPTWQQQTTRTASIAWVMGPAAIGKGSVELSTGNGLGPNAGGKAWLSTLEFSAKPPKLADITALSYATFIHTSFTGPVGVAPFLQLGLDTDGDRTTAETTLVFEPINSAATQGPIVRGVWQYWNARAGRWWLTKTISPTLVANSSYVTLDQITAQFPNAKLADTFAPPLLPEHRALRIGVGQANGGAWTDGAANSFVGNVDALTVGISGANTVYDFEASKADVALGPVNGLLSLLAETIQDLLGGATN